MTQLRMALERALRDVGMRIGQELRLGSAGGIGVRLGEPPVDVAIEWIEPAACVAVHAPFPIPKDLPWAAVAPTLLKLHLAGAGSRGCAFWLLPDDSVRVGLTLVGPHLDDEALLEAISRVVTVAAYLPSPHPKR